MFVVDLLRRAQALADTASGRSARTRGIAVLLMAALVAWRAAGTFAAFQWAGNWHSLVALYRCSIKARPHAYRASANLARELKPMGRLDLAEGWRHAFRERRS